MGSFHSYTGQPSKRPHGQKATFTQADTRHSAQSYDQDGRQWNWEQDNISGMPTSPLQPDFEAPWYPDLAYIKVNPDNTNECYIDYRQMYKDRKLALAQYHNNAVRWCTQNDKPVPERGMYPEYVTASAVGVPPRALELVVACIKGNPWVLGFAPVEDPRLVRFLERPITTDTFDDEEFDFGPDSYYAAAQTQAKVTPKQAPAKYRSFAEMKAANADAATEIEAETLATPEAQLENAWEAEGESLAEDGTEETALVDDEDEDSEALGGKTVHPKKQAFAAKQRPKRSHQKKTAVPVGGGKPREFGGGRKSLADGARPFTGADERDGAVVTEE